MVSPRERRFKTHVGHFLAKRGLRNRVQAVLFAYEIAVVPARHRLAQ